MRTEITGAQVDLVASHIRYQIARLESVLLSIEIDTVARDQYTDETLLQVETGIRQIRKLYKNL